MKIQINHIAKIEGHAGFTAEILKGNVQKAKIDTQDGARLIEFLGLRRSIVGLLSMVVLVGMGEHLAQQRVARLAMLHAPHETARHPQRKVGSGCTKAGGGDTGAHLFRFQTEQGQQLHRVTYGMGQFLLPVRDAGRVAGLGFCRYHSPPLSASAREARGAH